jgi:Protein of unknown function (DUF3300)
MHRRALLLSTTMLLALGAARAVRAQTPPAFKPEELDQMLAPVALYPDSLLSQVLMAAGYPLEVVEAERWSRANPTLKGDAALGAVKDKGWDTSVISLVAFPDVLAQMSDHLEWTQKLGDAMIGQPQDVADSVQRLRAQAAAAGNLQSTPQQTVTAQGSGDNVQYVIAPADPALVYVPAYNPAWVYGTWPYPAYPPVYYPFAGALARGFFWGVGFAAAGALFGGWNWGGRGNSYVNVNVNRAVNIDNHFDRTRINTDGRWQHNAEHRKGVGYRDAGTQARFQQARPGADQRAQFRGHVDNRPGAAPQPANRPQTANRPAPAQRPAVQNRGAAGGRANALDGVNRGQQVNREANRGHTQQQRAASHPPAARPASPPAARPAGGGSAPKGGGRR